MMKQNQFIQVFEYQTLRYSETDIFKEHHFNEMVKFNEFHQNKYFTILHKGIRFQQFVGVIQVGNLTIEILPKADKKKEADKAIWQSVLLDMLKICRKIQVNEFSDAQLKRHYQSILDVYFELYLNEIDRLLKKGFIKKYGKQQSNQTTLKGKLLFSENIQKNIVHKEKFYCEHQVYDKNHLLHQILYKALLISKHFISEKSQDKLNRLLYEFQDFTKLNVKKIHFDQIVMNRKNHNYKKALDIAKIIILNYSPSLYSGSESLIALLFDMNKLWEEYIFRVLDKHKHEYHLQVIAQNSQNFWEKKNIRPDIVLHFDHEDRSETLVIDTKWKTVEANEPSDNDLKQMFTYNLHWKAEKSLLLYPRVNQEDSHFGEFHYDKQQLNKKCKLGFLEIIENRRLKDSKNIVLDIIKKLDI